MKTKGPKSFAWMLEHYKGSRMKDVGSAGRKVFAWDPPTSLESGEGLIFVDATTTGANGAQVDGVFEAARLYAFHLAVLVPEGCILTGFNTRPRDNEYFSDVVRWMRSRGITKLYVVTFGGEAANYVLQWDAYNPGNLDQPPLLSGIGVVCGTIDRDFATLPRRGSQIAVFHGVPHPSQKEEEGGDPILPYTGGVGPGLSVALRCLVLDGRRPWRSAPYQMVERYAAANGRSAPEHQTVTFWPTPDSPILKRTQFGDPGKGDAVVVEHLIYGAKIEGRIVGNRYTFNGRDTGGAAESEFSGMNGEPLPKSRLNIWEHLAAAFGWRVALID